MMARASGTNLDQFEYMPGGKCATSIQIRNLPGSWARRGYTTKANLLNIAQGCTAARLSNPYTGESASVGKARQAEVLRCLRLR